MYCITVDAEGEIIIDLEPFGLGQIVIKNLFRHKSRIGIKAPRSIRIIRREELERCLQQYIPAPVPRVA